MGHCVNITFNNLNYYTNCILIIESAVAVIQSYVIAVACTLYSRILKRNTSALDFLLCHLPAFSTDKRNAFWMFSQFWYKFIRWFHEWAGDVTDVEITRNYDKNIHFSTWRPGSREFYGNRNTWGKFCAWVAYWLSASRNFSDSESNSVPYTVFLLSFM